MRKDTITTRRPGPQALQSSEELLDPATRRPAARGRTAWLRLTSKHKVLGTAFLAAKVHQWGRNKVLGWLFALFLGLPVGILLLAAWPWMAYGVSLPPRINPQSL